MSTSRICSRCSAPLVSDLTTNSGNLTCTGCGCVAYENPIVSEVSFGETASGGAVVQGTMVNYGQSRPTIVGRQNAMDSREQTLNNGRRSIRDLAASLSIPDFIADAGYSWFLLALNQNFVKGRRSQNVTAACLYIACRKERTHHLLIDFSSKLQISVFTLGSTFLKMVRYLNIVEIPLADPSLFISHFAEKLQFDSERENGRVKVIKDAMMIAKRMSDDWIHEGRRPAGIAGACILLAARMNGFNRSHAEIVAVSHVSEGTLQTRLGEFGKTDAGSLSLSQFRQKSDTLASANPPSFNRQALKKKRIQESYEQKLKKLNDATGTGIRPGRLTGLKEKGGRLGSLRGRRAGVQEPVVAETVEVVETVEPGATEATEAGETEVTHEVEGETGETGASEATSAGAEIAGTAEAADDNPILYREMKALGFNPDLLAKEMSSFTAIINKGYEAILAEKKANDADRKNLEQQRRQDIENDPNAPRNLVEKCKPTSYYLDLVPSTEDLTELDVDDDELDAYLNDEETVQLKEVAWTNKYKDYLLEQERKKLKAEADELSGNTSATKRRKKNGVNVDLGVADAVKAVGGKEVKKLSKKINYINMDQILGVNN